MEYLKNNSGLEGLRVVVGVGVGNSHVLNIRLKLGRDERFLKELGGIYRFLIIILIVRHLNMRIYK